MRTQHDESQEVVIHLSHFSLVVMSHFSDTFACKLCAFQWMHRSIKQCRKLPRTSLSSNFARSRGILDSGKFSYNGWMLLWKARKKLQTLIFTLRSVDLKLRRQNFLGSIRRFDTKKAKESSQEGSANDCRGRQHHPTLSQLI